MCGTRSRRDAQRGEAIDLLARADPGQLVAVLDRLRIGGLFAARAGELGVPLHPELEADLRARREWARHQGTAHELLSLSVLSGLERAGIRALGLKGSILGRQLYGDPGVRTVGDIDVLVAVGDLPRAIAALEQMGWRRDPWGGAPGELPPLHETLSHPTHPVIEVHWRVHWYETRFSADALARAQRSGAHDPLEMTPEDGLAALLLFYARDGFSGLRMAADVAAWWDARCHGRDADAIIDAAARAYPELAEPLRASGALLAGLVGLPTRVAPRRLRPRVAGALADPFPADDPAQLGATASLVDVLLTPPRGIGAALRRELQKFPEGIERPLRPEDGMGAYAARIEHLVRVARRWALALAEAAGRALRPEPATGGGIR